MKDNHIRILIVEDSEYDTMLIIRNIKSGGYEPEYERVETENQMRDALKADNWDIIIADYVLPAFSGLKALELLKNMELDIPLIMISGNVSEETAVSAMNAGAHDSIMKDNLTRLIPAIKRELRAHELRNVYQREISAMESAISPDLDEVDYQIIEMLTDDGRMKLVDIGEHIKTKEKRGFSHVGVKNRISKLIERNFIKIQSNINMDEIGFVMAILMLEVDSIKSLEHIVKKFDDDAHVLFSFQTTGKFNLVYGLISYNIKSLESYINHESPKNESGVKDSSVFISTTFCKPEYWPLDPKILKKIV